MCLVVLAVSMLVLAAAPASGNAGARQLWVARYNDRNDSSDYANTLAVSPDGSTVFVTGHDDRKWITVAYDARTGARHWTAKYHPALSGANEADGLAVSRDGSRVFVTGGTRSRAIGWDAVTLAYDASTGEQLWEARSTGGPGKAYASAGEPRVSPDGSAVYVTVGRVFAYAAATGRRLWVSQSAGGFSP
jgi:outer membrane protein assembly factor BamB